MVALPVPPQRLPVNLVRSGRKQPQREHCVPGCGWQGCLHLQTGSGRIFLNIASALGIYRSGVFCYPAFLVHGQAIFPAGHKKARHEDGPNMPLESAMQRVRYRIDNG